MNQYIKQLIEYYFYEHNQNNFINEIIEKRKLLTSLIEMQFSESDFNVYNDDYIIENMETDMSELDKELNGEETNIGSFIRQNTPIIYAFITNMVKPAVKIGFTTQGPQKRLEQWRKYFPDAQLIGYWSSVEFIEDVQKQTKTKVFFQDFPVHNATVQRGFANLTRDEFNKEIDNLAQEEFSFDLTTLTRHYSKEFFKKENLKKEILTKEVVEEIVQSVKDKIKSGDRTNIQTYDISSFEKQRSGGTPPSIKDFPKTDLQKEAINNGIKAIDNNKTHLLLGAVMRFGKTFTAYQIVLQKHFKKVIVVSAVADTRESWRNDIYHKDFINDFCFVEYGSQKHSGMYLVSDKTTYQREYFYQKDFIENELTKKLKYNTIIVYTTLQDLSGKLDKDTKDRTIKDRHKELFNIEWDLLIADETHFATRSSVNGKTLGYTNNPDDAISDATSQDIKEFTDQNTAATELRELIKPLKTKIQLHLSGTPYNIMMTDEFTNEQSEVIGRYSYTDMLKARDEWVVQHPDQPEWESPYFGVPNLIRFGLNLTKECREELKQLKKEDISESFSKLFAVKPGTLKFKHQKAIKELMYSIFGNPQRKRDNKLVGFLNRPEIKEGEVMKHLVICLPYVTQCHALAKLLNENVFIKNNPKREVIVAVENTNTIELRNLGNTSRPGYISPEAEDANKLNKTLSTYESQGKQTVTLTVDKLMTAVSIPLWDAMLYFKDIENPQEYDQNVFRLCTRNVHKDVDKDGNVISMTNLKENVYLIDFKIERLFNIMIDSIRQQNTIQDKKGLSSIQKTVQENIEKMPIYLDGIGDKLTQMKQLDVKDFMNYYTSYNKHRSIEDSIQMKYFQGWISGDKLDVIINKFDDKFSNKSGKTDLNTEDGDTTLSFDEIIAKAKAKQTETKEKNKQGQGSDKKQNTEEKKKIGKVINLLKNILYFSMCLNDCLTLDNMIKQCSENNDINNMAKDFGLNKDILSFIRQNCSSIELNELDTEIYNIQALKEDESRSPLENVQVAINKLGQINKNEVVTPENLVNKMLDKIQLKKGQSILEVNSKYGEFLIQIYKRYGKEIANNVKIIPSSSMTKHFIQKIVNILGLSEQNILDINDKKENYNIKDFINISNDKILKYNNDMKWDVILANPPFDNGLHEKFEVKFFDLCKGQICWVSPAAWLLGKRQNKKITSQIDKYNCNIESINGNNYFDAAIGGTMSIVYVNMNDNKQHIIYDNVLYNKCEQITTYSNDKLLVQFKNIIEPLCRT